MSPPLTDPGRDPVSGAVAGRSPAQLVVRVVVAVILLVAAGLKAYGLATGPAPGQGFLSSRAFLGALINVEVWLACFLLAGVFIRFVWAVSAAAFAAFLVVAVYRAASGEATCGCFGPVEINPWYTAALDAAVLVAMAALWPRGRAAPASLSRAASPWPRALAAAAVASLACVAADVSASRYRPAVISKSGAIVGAGDAVTLTPETWIGQPCPLLAHADIGSELGRGAWTVVLYRYKCPHCAAALPRYLDEARSAATRPSPRRLALLEIAPYAPPGESPVPAGSPCLVGKLSDDKRWIIQTPYELTLDDGKVTAARRSPADVASPPPNAS